MLSILKNKQVAYLFLISFTVLFTGFGLFPILPLFAAEFQASKSLIGLYFAIIYAANAFGPVAAGWLIARFSKRAVLIAGGVIGVPALALLASARNFTMVILLTAVLWLSGGMVMALVNIMTGLHTGANSRGKAYSLLALAGPLGALVGSGFIGWLVSWQGYSLMFTALALIWTIIPLIGLLRLQEGQPGAANKAAKVRNVAHLERVEKSGPLFPRLIAFVFLGSLAVNLSRFGASLSMQAAGLSPETVSGVAIIGGIATIPFILAVGTLSDRLGRKRFLVISLLFTLSGALILTRATAVWQYGLASIFNMIAFSVSAAMAQALTGEIVPVSTLDQSLARLNAFAAGASILSFAAGGWLFDLLGLPVVFLIAALAALASGTGVEVFIHPCSAEEPGLSKEGCVN
jgi:MFS family permease